MNDLRTNLSQTKQSDRNLAFSESQVDYTALQQLVLQCFRCFQRQNHATAEPATALPWAALSSDVVMETNVTFLPLYHVTCYQQTEVDSRECTNITSLSINC